MKRTAVMGIALLAVPAFAQTTTTQCRTDQWGNTTCTSEKAPGIDWSLANRPPPAPTPSPPPYAPPAYIPITRPAADNPGPGVPFGRGNEFVRLCDSDKWKVGCVGYTLGLFHGTQQGAGTFCKPDGVDTGQLYQVAIRYIEANPQIAHHAAFSLILESWEKAFPC